MSVNVWWEPVEVNSSLAPINQPSVFLLALEKVYGDRKEFGVEQICTLQAMAACNDDFEWMVEEIRRFGKIRIVEVA